MPQAHGHRLTIYLIARPFQALPVSLQDFWEVFDKAWQSVIFIVWVFHVTPGFMGQEMPHKKPNFCNRKLLWIFHPQCAKTFLSTEQFRCKNKLWHVRNTLAATVIRCIRGITNPAMNCTGAKQFVVLEPLQNDSKLHIWRELQEVAEGLIPLGSTKRHESWHGFHHPTGEGPLWKERNVLIIMGHSFFQTHARRFHIGLWSRLVLVSSLKENHQSPKKNAWPSRPACCHKVASAVK